MSLAKPEWLLCLIALPLIGLMAWLSWKKRGDRWKKLVAPRLQGRLSHLRPSWVHFTSLGLGLAGLAALIVAVAEPESGEEWIEIENEGRNILFCVDISRSMLAEDVKPNRLKASRVAALEILERFPTDRVGVVLFAGEPLVQSPLTIDHSFVEQTLAQLDSNDIPVGGSNLTDAVISGTRLLIESGQQSNIMVVLSDGEKSTQGLEEAASRAAEQGVFIYSIGIGTPEGSFIPDPRERDGKFRDRSGNVVFSKLNEEALETLAETTDGYYSRGMGRGFLGKLDSALAEMDRFREEGKHQRVAKPAHRWFVFGGLLLIMTSIFVRCLPLAPIVSLAAILLGTPRAEAGLVEDGVAALRTGSPKEAHLKFKEAAKEASGERAAGLYLAAGSAAAKAQNWESAASSFSSALSSQDSGTQQKAHYALATSLFYLGVPLEKAEKITAWKGAIEHFEASLDIQPDHIASSDNLKSVREQLAELEKEEPPQEKPKEEEKKPSDQNQEKEEKEEKDNPPQKEDDQSNENEPGDQPKEQDDPKNEGEPNQEDQNKKGEPNPKDPSKEPEQGGEKESKDPGKSPTELKPDPNAPKGETPRERARRLLKQYSDLGEKAPRRIRRPYNRNPHDW